MFSSSDNTESDWLLYCGGWLVGRVRKLATVRQDVFTWSLTGPHARIVSMRGDAATVQAAKESLIAAVRAWAAWAAVRADGADKPRWVCKRELQPRSFGAAYEDETDWVLMSGGFVVGRVHRPLIGPRHDPYWALTGAHTPQAGFEQRGWAQSIEDGKSKLFSAWCAWLRWAELPVPPSP